jgi:hypothetical protein
MHWATACELKADTCAGAQGPREASKRGGNHSPHEEETGVGRFEVIAEAQQRRRWSAPPVPLGTEEWAASMDSQGRIIDRKAVEGRIYLGGIASDLRRCVVAVHIVRGALRSNCLAHQRLLLLFLSSPPPGLCKQTYRFCSHSISRCVPHVQVPCTITASVKSLVSVFQQVAHALTT